MKILFTQDALINAGTERSNLELMSRFSEEIQHGLVYFYPKHELKEEFEGAGIRLFFLDIPEKYHLVKATYRLVALIKKEKPDLLVSSLWRADIITRIASWYTGVPLVGTLVNDSYSQMAWKDKSGFKHRVVHWIDRITSGVPVHWIANSEALVDSHVKTLGLDRSKISVVYRGRKVPDIAPAKSDIIAPARRDGREEGPKQSQKNKKASEESTIEDNPSPKHHSLSMTDSIRNFISYGRLQERKGFQDAIQALSQVLQSYPDCTLTIFGEGSYRKELESLVQDLGLENSVFLPGKIANPMDLLINGYCLPGTANCQLPTDHSPLLTADCFLFPSWYEGFSGALVEAMMAGIPIIASDIPMNLEAVKDNESALIFQARDPSSLSQIMLYAINNQDLMYNLGEKARIEARKRFDIERISEEYEHALLKIYKSLKN